jgi:peptidoglycan hydrolase-like protein with peptidoglycan-binding domain
VVDDATALGLGLTKSSLFGLTEGTRGDAVKTLQQKLIASGISVSGGADGIFGPGTTRAVADFQKSRGFAPTGLLNAATAATLGQVDASSPAATPQEPAASTSDSTSSSAQSSSLVGLKIGSRGEGVMKLQGKIMAAGFTVVGGADGIFGALTANALKSFQNANGLDMTGVVNDATAKVLDSIGDGDSSDSTEPATVTNPFTGLQYGSLGADVKALQNALLTAGIRVRGGADGVFGVATQAAVKEYQGQHGLNASGKVDAETASVLSSGASASSGSSLTGLKAGALGNTVKSLQQSLIDAGIKVRGGADGIFGPATANALKEFQTSQGLSATGVVDDATAAALANPQKPVPSVGSPNESEGGFPSYGEKGTRVVGLQAALVKSGISVRGGVDGDFGAGTAAAVMDFQRANGLSVTGKVSDTTAAKLGLDRMAAPKAPDPSSVTLDAFPVESPCYFGDSWGFRRGGGRVHLGVDVIAAAGTNLFAVAAGTITKVYADYPGALAGNGVRLTTADGTYFFYAHMSAVADGIKVGSKVSAGQVIGTVGNTGNSGTNHLHFEIHPKGGSAVNPYPLLKAIDAC